MDTIKSNARTAGALYLLLVLVAPLRLVYIPHTLFVGVRGRLGTSRQPAMTGAVA